MSRTLLKLLLAIALLLSADAAAAPPADEPESVAEGGDGEHSEQELDEAKEEFMSIDTNKDGFVTRAEILEMEEVPESEEITEFFETYDTNKDGKVAFEEIVAADAQLREETQGDGSE